jgi:hypothetical protein
MVIPAASSSPPELNHSPQAIGLNLKAMFVS